MQTNSLLEAVRIVKENEQRAMQGYAAAAGQVPNPLGKQLFQQLSAFEQYHYERLSALENSLQADGNFILYDPKEFPMPPSFEIVAAQDAGKKSLMQLITEARRLEEESEKAYAELALQVTDPRGHEMFTRLSEEEHQHYRILTEAFWSLNATGVWKWPGQ